MVDIVHDKASLDLRMTVCCKQEECMKGAGCDMFHSITRWNIDVRKRDSMRSNNPGVHTPLNSKSHLARGNLPKRVRAARKHAAILRSDSVMRDTSTDACGVDDVKLIGDEEALAAKAHSHRPLVRTRDGEALPHGQVRDPARAEPADDAQAALALARDEHHVVCREQHGGVAAARDAHDLPSETADRLKGGGPLVGAAAQLTIGVIAGRKDGGVLQQNDGMIRPSSNHSDRRTRQWGRGAEAGPLGAVGGAELACIVRTGDEDAAGGREDERVLRAARDLGDARGAELSDGGPGRARREVAETELAAAVAAGQLEGAVGREACRVGLARGDEDDGGGRAGELVVRAGDAVRGERGVGVVRGHARALAGVVAAAAPDGGGGGQRGDGAVLAVQEVQQGERGLVREAVRQEEAARGRGAQAQQRRGLQRAVDVGGARVRGARGVHGREVARVEGRVREEGLEQALGEG